MVSESERAKILEMIESGTITAEEGLTLLNALGETPAIQKPEFDFEAELSDDPTDSDESGVVFAEVADESTLYEGEAEILPESPTPPSPEEMQKWKRWWVIPLWIGTGITVIGGLLMYWAFSASGFGFWFACAWFPFLLGVAVLALAWSSRTSPWLHVRVHQKPGETPQKIAISLPIPIRLTAWGLRTFGHYIPYFEGTSLDEVILALENVSAEEAPFFVDVDEGEAGERVQVFIG